MIFSIDHSVIEQGEEVILNFAKTLLDAAEKQHYVQVSPKVLLWIEQELFNTNKYLGTLARESLKGNKDFWQPTSMCQKYQRHVTIGYNTNMLPVEKMALLVEEPSVVVLENGRYDWAVIKKWIELYKNDRGLKTINQQVNRAVITHQLREHNAGGGNGSITNIIKELMHIYEGLHALRLTTVFDSDKHSAHDATDHNQHLKAFLDKNQIKWHELKKREIENYFDIETYRRAGLLADNAQDYDFTAEEWDFLDIGKSKIIKMEKRDVERLSELLIKDELKKHATALSGEDEIQAIILHLAKYI